jgi:hypothetical protein
MGSPYSPGDRRSIFDMTTAELNTMRKLTNS